MRSTDAQFYSRSFRKSEFDLDSHVEAKKIVRNCGSKKRLNFQASTALFASVLMKMKPLCSRYHLQFFAGKNIGNFQQFRCSTSSTSGDGSVPAKAQLDSLYSDSPEYPPIAPPAPTRKHVYKTLERLKYERKVA